MPCGSCKCTLISVPAVGVENAVTSRDLGIFLDSADRFPSGLRLETGMADMRAVRDAFTSRPLSIESAICVTTVMQ